MKKNFISVPVLLAVGALLTTSIQTHAQDNKGDVPNADDSEVAAQALEDKQPLEEPSVAEQAASPDVETTEGTETVEATETEADIESVEATETEADI